MCIYHKAAMKAPRLYLSEAVFEELNVFEVRQYAEENGLLLTARDKFSTQYILRMLNPCA